MKVRRTIRVNTSLSSLSNRKLRLLANSCNKPRATMSQMLLDHCLDDPLLVKKFQDHYNTVEAYRVKAIMRGDQCIYVSEKDEQVEPIAPTPHYQSLKSLGVLV